MYKSAIPGLCILLALPALGDSEVAPYPSVTSSEMGTCYFKQVPGILERDEVTGELSEKQPAYGVAYRIDMFGTETEMWRTSDWYSFKVFIADTCDYLVRMGNWSVGRQPGPEDLAVAFYHNGQRLKEYSTADLVKDYSSVEISASHYTWQARSNEFPRLVDIYEFHLVTTDQIHYVFDVKTGLISEKR